LVDFQWNQGSIHFEFCSIKEEDNRENAH